MATTLAARSRPVHNVPVGAWALPAAVTCLLVVFAAQTAHAADWRFTPAVGVDETWSDNVDLSENDKREEFITDANAGFSLRGTGRRLTVDVFYNAQAVFYGKDTQDDDLRHQLQASAMTEVWDDILFLDLDASVRQELISNTGVSSSSNVVGTSNQTNVITFSYGWSGESVGNSGLIPVLAE